MRVPGPMTHAGFVVEGGRGGIARTPWRHLVRLSFAFAAREIAIRYRAAWLGALWALAQPAALTAATTWVVQSGLGVQGARGPFAVEAAFGLLAWSFLAAGLAAAVPCFVGQADLVRKIWFPRGALPVGHVLGAGPDLAIGLVALVAALPLWGVSWRPHLLLLPVLALPLVLFALAAAVASAAMNVRWRDVKHALPLALQLGFLLTPVLYPLARVPQPWRDVLGSLPPAATIEAWRAAAFGQWPEPVPFGIGLLLGALALVAAWRLLGRLAPRFGDDL